MESTNEKINYENPLLSIKTFQAHREPRKESSHITWHYHKEIEMLAILSGEMDVYVEDNVFFMKPGNVTLIGKHQVHTDKLRGRQSMDYICVQFDIEQYFDQSTMPYFKYFSETKRPLSDLNYILTENEAARNTFEVGPNGKIDASNIDKT